MTNDGAKRMMEFANSIQFKELHQLIRDYLDLPVLTFTETFKAEDNGDSTYFNYEAVSDNATKDSKLLSLFKKEYYIVMKNPTFGFYDREETRPYFDVYVGVTDNKETHNFAIAVFDKDDGWNLDEI